jgi:RNA polymerase sigma factor (sigma-70 family)
MVANPDQLTDAEIIAQVLAGNQARYRLLVERHQQAVFNAAYRLLGQREEAADVSQDAFLRAYQTLDSFQIDRPLKPWLCRIAVNLALNRLKRQRPALTLDGGQEEPGLDLPDTSAEPQAALLQDDVGFLQALIEHLQAEYKADPARIFVTGISNGGLMSFRLACDLPDQIRAIAPVTASIPKALETHCSRPAEVGLLLLNGTEDPLVPYDGGQITALGRKRGEVLSTDETIALWLNKTDCQDQADITSLPDQASDDGTTVTVSAYPECKVVLYRIDGGGHTWPGGWQYLGEKRIGKTTREINAADEIWRFFRTFHDVVR